ncbi:protein 5NUC-like [Haematobia irritans]|uniref:protein 5NUC-like n=1 Tax=Haematobia irritans TaxID=7368 RepID=UPI003F509C94
MTSPRLCLILIYLRFFWFTLEATNANPINGEGNDVVTTEFIILHNNDIHARFEETSASSEKCTQDLAKANKCFGGIARVAHIIREHREQATNRGIPVVYLNAGDTATGTPWYYLFKDEIAATFLNILQPDAVSLGNHEFDSGIPGLLPFLEKVNFPIVAANLNLSKVPQLEESPNLYKSTILDINGVKVGVIGYITPETLNKTMTKIDIFTDEIDAINKESAFLKSAGINIIIALGHSGFEKDQEIALNCNDVDLVVGGHTNTFLFNGNQPDAERIVGPYPTVVKQDNGKLVPVVQAYAYTKYMGKLHVKFDHEGNLLEFEGNPILLNSDIPQETDVLQLLEVYRPKVNELEADVIGHTRVHLEGRRQVCRHQECNLGNLITDAMVYARILEDFGGSYWSDASIAFMQGGAIRSSIEKRSDGSILALDVASVMPFKNDLYVTQISGKSLLDVLEHSASMFETDSKGGFLQMSGIHTTFDYNNPVGTRVVEAKILCTNCDVPTYQNLREDQMYNVIVPYFLMNGGDGYKFVEHTGPKPQRMQINDSGSLTQYLKRHEFVYPVEEQRITIIQKTNEVNF